MDLNKSPIKLTLNQAYSSAEPLLWVKGLTRAGEYQFQLVVTDEAGNSSKAAVISVTVEPEANLCIRFTRRLQMWLSRLLGKRQA
ncbi:hypothetical protein [Paraglaciecola aestuariivivens]